MYIPRIHTPLRLRPPIVSFPPTHVDPRWLRPTLKIIDALEKNDFIEELSLYGESAESDILLKKCFDDKASKWILVRLFLRLLPKYSELLEFNILKALIYPMADIKAKTITSK